MKNTVKAIGLIAILAIITFTTACASTGNADTPAPEPNTITITDITDLKATKVGVFVMNNPTDWGDASVASGAGRIENGSVTFELGANNKPYTGTGNFYVAPALSDDVEGGYWQVYRTKTKIKISTGNTTIAFSEFEKLND